MGFYAKRHYTAFHPGQQYHHDFLFFQPSFLNGMFRFLNSLRHNVKAEVSFDAKLTERSFRRTIRPSIGHSFGQRFYPKKKSCVRTLTQ